MLQFPKIYFALLLLLPLWGTTFGDVSPYRIDEYHATAFPDCGKMKTKVVFEIIFFYIFYFKTNLPAGQQSRQRRDGRVQKKTILMKRQ